jgi:acyl-CoA synthetase (AMP-forming)/AMP-acid ligase II
VWLEAARGHRVVTNGQLADVVEAWAGWGAGRASRVGLLAPDPLDFAVLFVALIAAGVTVVPLDPRAPVAAQRDLLDRAGASVVAAAGVPHADTALGRPVHLLGAGLAPPTPPSGGDATGIPGTGGVLLFSSGSTGPRKAILLTEPQLLHVARAVAEHHGLGPRDRGLNPLPLFHVNAEVVAVLGSFVSTGTLVLDDRFHSTGFADLVRRRGITWINAVPAILSILPGEPGSDPLPPAVRFVRSASAPLPVPVLERFEARWGVRVLETYGMTEAASQITANPLRGPRKPGSVGLPVGVEVRVGADRNVWIRGPGVIRGYADGAGADRFDADGWLDTGDVGRFDAEGYLYLSGRGGDAINRGGEKIFPREIEEVLRREPVVGDVVVVPRPDAVLGEVPVAVVVPRTGTRAVDDEELRAALTALAERDLPRPHRPVDYRVVETMPLGPTGKVSRPALRDQLDHLPVLAFGRDAPVEPLGGPR